MDSTANASSPLRDVSAGVVAGAVAVVYAMSYAALLFTGPLKAMLPYGIGLALASATLGALWLAWRSELPFAIGGPDGNTTSILAGMLATLATAATPVSQVGLSLALTTWLCAFLFLVLGLGRLGSAVRFIPFPVVGGFLASTGWLIAMGGLNVGADLPSNFTTDPLGSLLADGRLLATAGLGLGYFVVLRRWRAGAVAPFVVLLSALGLAGALALAGKTTHDWRFAMRSPVEWVGPWELWRAAAKTDWQWVAGQWLDMVAVATVALITVLLGATGLELRTRRDISLDHELRTHGWLNLLAPLLGAYVSVVSVGRSVVLLESGARTRLAGVVVAIVCALAAWGGTAILGWVPRPVLGGFLLYLGAAILWEWVVESRQTMGLADWCLVVIILATTAVIGFTVAVVAGVIASCVSFALSQSRVGVVQHDLDGTVIHSTVLRPATQRNLLAQRGADIRVLVLRGVIFFGTASSLLERVRGFITQRAASPGAKVLVLDFTHVASVDSSAAMTLSKIAHLGETAGVHVVLCGAHGAWSAALPADATSLASLDLALEAAEESVIAAAGAHSQGVSEPLEQWMPGELGGQSHWDVLRPLLRRRELARGEVLMRQGVASDETVCLVESGRLTVRVDGQNEGQRLATLMAGNMAGEMALYGDAERSANVTAEDDCVVWTLSRADLEHLHAEAPDTAMRVHAFIVRGIAARVRQANATIAALQRGT